MADIQTDYPCVEVKCLRGQPRIYIRHQSINSNKKKIVKSLTYEEWQALKDCMSMVDEQISKLSTLSKPYCKDYTTTQNNWYNNTLNDETGTDFETTLNTLPSPMASESYQSISESTSSNYTVDEKVVADLLSILQQTTQEKTWGTI
jgi:hypothetical protein